MSTLALLLFASRFLEKCINNASWFNYDDTFEIFFLRLTEPLIMTIRIWPSRAQYPIYQAWWWACYVKWCQEVLVKYRFIRFVLSLYLRSLSSCHTAMEMISSWLRLRQKEQTHCYLPFFPWVMLTAECRERIADMNYFHYVQFNKSFYLSLIEIESTIFTQQSKIYSALSKRV